MAETLGMAALDTGYEAPEISMAEGYGEATLETPAPSDEQVLRAVRAYKQEADQARQKRMALNERNWRAYYGEQDFTQKLPGQSREVIPKVAESVEALASFVKKGLTDFGNWFSVTVPHNSPLPAPVIQKIISVILDGQSQMDEGRLNFPTLTSDAIKVASLGSLMIFKVCHFPYMKRQFIPERGMEVLRMEGRPPMMRPTSRLVSVEQPMAGVAIDLIPPEDFYPDPTGRNLYVIHSVERDLADVQDMADQGAYDPDVVAELTADCAQVEYEAFKQWSRNQDQSVPPPFRKRVVIDECWATFLDDDGRAVLRNAYCAVANDRYVIRSVTPNPYWHQQTPFVWAPLIRIPFSEWHKAVQDNAVSLNMAQNELVNLIIDGGYEAVWGVRQLHLDWLEDPTQVQDGVSPGDTLLVRQEVPAGAKVLERVTTGGVPQDALAVYNLLDKEYNAASMINDVKLGQMPAKDVKATEIVASEQHSNAAFEGIIKDIEDTCIEPLLWKIWLTALQFLDDFSAEDIVAAIGERWAFVLSQMTPAERYAQFAGTCSFQASGLSATVARGKDFQKLMAFIQLGTGSPFLAQTFLQNYSAKKYLDRILQSLNLDPEALSLTPDEQAQQMAQYAVTQAMQGAQGGGAGTANRLPTGGVPGLQFPASTGGAPMQGSPMPREAASRGGPAPGLQVGGQPSVPTPPQAPPAAPPPIYRGPA